MPETESPGPSWKVSVLIFSRNRVEDLRKTLTALQSAEPKGAIEVIVLDAASRDGSAEIDHEFPDVIVLRTTKLFGWTRAHNIGLRTAKGSYVLFLPNGAEVRKDTIANLAQFLEQQSDALAACPLELDAHGQCATIHYKLPDAAALNTRWKEGGWGAGLPVASGTDPAAIEFPDGSPLLVRRQAIVGMNYLDQRFGHFGGALELCFEIRRAGKKIYLLPTASMPAVPRPAEQTRGVFAADLAIGLAEYSGKHFGLVSGLLLRLKFALALLFRFDFGGFFAAASGQKIDGTQSEA